MRFVPVCPPTTPHPTPAQLYTTLKRFADASLRHLDCWDVSIPAPDPSYFPELPYALQPAPDNVRPAAALHCALVPPCAALR